MGKLLYLESFDQDVSNDDAAGELTQTYADGLAAGLVEAAEKFAADQVALRQELVQSVCDAAFSYHEAQAHMAASVAPLLEAMVSAILPAMLAPALHAHVMDMVQSALKTDLQRPVTLKVPAGQRAAVEAALADAQLPHIDIVTDPTLGGHAAWLIGPEQETALDLDETLAAIKAHMSALISPPVDRNSMKAS